MMHDRGRKKAGAQGRLGKACRDEFEDQTDSGDDAEGI